MPEHALSRRSFLAATGGLLALTACGSSSKVSSSSSNSNVVAGILSSDLYVSPQPQRVAFELQDSHGQFASGPPAQLALVTPSGTSRSPVTANLHRAGLPKRRGVYVADVVLDTPGSWPAAAIVGGTRHSLAFSVAATATVPIPGEAAPRDASPTTANTLGVDPICTRDPVCPLHAVSLDTVIGKGKPVAVLFATPARCTSRYCGPVLDNLLTLVPKYQNAMTFVHVEIYKNSTTEDLIPTVEAWKLPSEPWLFGIDRAGNITARLDAGMGRDEMDALLAKLASS